MKTSNGRIREFTRNAKMEEYGIVGRVADVFARIFDSAGEDLQSSVWTLVLELDVLTLLQLLAVLEPADGSVGSGQFAAQDDFLRDVAVEVDVLFGVNDHHRRLCG